MSLEVLRKMPMVTIPFLLRKRTLAEQAQRVVPQKAVPHKRTRQKPVRAEKTQKMFMLHMKLQISKRS